MSAGDTRDRGQSEPGEASGGDFTTTVWLLSLGAMTALECRHQGVRGKESTEGQP